MSRGLPGNVKSCLLKAIDSALLAVEIYNKPAVKFKSGGYIVLMCIAYTSLFHAIFLRRKQKPIYKEKNSNRYKKVDGELQFWELSKCSTEYFGDTNSAIKANINFFIPLRNKIEHKFMPEIDANIFAECQSMLLNFDKIVEREFGEEYCLRESLSFALQLFPSKSTLHSVVENKDSAKIVDFINRYRLSISTDIQLSGEFAFKAFLIQVTNHKSKDALPIQFFSYDKLSEGDKVTVDRIAALIKEKTVYIANKDKIKPATVVSKVQEYLGNPTIQKGKKIVDKFNMDTHTRCWKKYCIRPEKGNTNPQQTNQLYCVYDEPNNQYLYTEEWVNFLIEKIQNEDEYNSLFI